LVPILREYRRASTTAIDASLKPLMQRHLREMFNFAQGAMTLFAALTIVGLRPRRPRRSSP
jgi:N-methylhydantoinase A/oxoprolinase/acetone carboxylase beta subunit